MEDPVKEIPSIIHRLTQSRPSEQRETIETYFTRDASFTHPFVRTGSFENSRLLIRAIYRWYKIMSPRIDLEVHSVAFDEASLRLYVHLSQIFRIWLIPFYSAPVTLVTVLQLVHSSKTNRYYISSQNDLYQVDQFVRFFWPGGVLVVWAWQIWATVFSVLGALLLAPVTWFEEKVYNPGGGWPSPEGVKIGRVRVEGLVQGVEVED
ncbi:hypothetical protein H2201_005095 [Coniosporium apollinis]|uniref:SigF-like NTF2-like domain-containing protein n=1 Tax=Coniosporium apollinis TaxID=61459 RepID=A0ABQ9NR23_9PEZI|nr:hypothetical protein H2201_005095 [Coniosporium apollinis]